MMNTIKTICVVLISTAFAACSGFLEEYSKDQAKVESWIDLDEMLVGDGYLSTSCYTSSPYDNNYNVNYNFDLLHFMSDELKENTEDNRADYCSYTTRMFSFYTWQRDTGMDEKLKYTGGDDSYWNALYKRISSMNIVLSQIDQQPATEESDIYGKERVKGEAAFLRAAYYFLLVNLYGEPYQPATAQKTPAIPLKLTEYIEDIEFERATVEEVYRQIEKDLETAEACLEGKARVSVMRANLTAAYLLHSRVCLYMQQWEQAAKLAQKVLELQDGLINLNNWSVGTNAVYKNSPETIFTMGGYMIAFAFYDTRYYAPSYYISDDMMQLYDNADDLRRRFYIGSSYRQQAYPVYTKIDGQYTAYGRVQDVSDCFLLRTPEAYLTLAEASAYAGDEDTARKTLTDFLATRMRNRVEVTETGNDLIDLIRDERAREFLLEGQRWFDLRRYTVCTPYPWSKQIEHGHTYYQDYAPAYTEYYRLEKDDKAYTLPVPRKILEFQPSLGNSSRPDRRPIRTERY